MNMLLSAVAGQGGVKVPGAPGTLSLSAGSDAYTQINLSWSAPSDTGGGTVSGYRIKKDGSVLVADTGSTGTTYTASGLTVGTSYNFTVAAINEKGTGADGNTPSRTTKGVIVYSTTGSPTVTNYTNYRSLAFTGSGTFVVTANPESDAFDVLVVGGGGGGGGVYGGGAGAGGMNTDTGETAVVQTYTVTVGGGGGFSGGASTHGDDGTGSTMTGSGYSFGASTYGGGWGARGQSDGDTGRSSLECGSAGAGGWTTGSTAGGTLNVAAWGSAGGNGGGTLTYDGAFHYYYAGGGGGGKGAVGGVGSQASTGGTQGVAGNGGNGSTNNYKTGVNITYAGGGGGAGAEQPGTGAPTCNSTATGGTGGGGNGGCGNAGAATNGSTNLGGGGGGGAQSADPGTGGSGIVVIRIPYNN
jgi:hypothetical protein